MTFRLYFCLLAFLATRALAFSTAPYLPLADGNSWTYQTNGVSGTRTVQPGSYYINSVATKLIQYSEGDQRYMSNDANGIREHKAYTPPSYVAGLGYVSETDVFSPPIRFANANANIGDYAPLSGTVTVTLGGNAPFILNYAGSSSVIGYESVTVPTGTYNALKISGSISFYGYFNGNYVSGSETEVFWVVPTLGVVRNDTTVNGGSPRIALLTGSNLLTATASVSPSSLSFGNQGFNTTSAAQTVTFFNTGTTTLAIPTIQTSGSFSQTNNCQSAARAPGGSCTINVSFTALGGSGDSGSLTITTDAGNSPQTVSLAGTSTFPLSISKSGGGTITSSPAGINCGATCGADVAASTLVTLTPTAASGYVFSGWGGDCVGSGSCQVLMNRARSVSASFTATAPLVGFSWRTVGFTDQAVHTSSAAVEVALANNGNGTLTISTITAGGDFSQTNTCGASLAPSGVCSIYVIFTPTAVGARSGTLSISSNAAGSPHTLSLTGTGLYQTTTSLVPGWNLLGNGSTSAINVAATFGETSQVYSVWKWVAANGGSWAYFAPGQSNNGADYAASKGYGFLTTINGGEGFWVNAKIAFVTPLGSGSPLALASLRDGGAAALPSGWSLIAVGDGTSPRAFANGIAAAPPSPGSPAATSIVSLWTWHPGDAAIAAGWLFYSPSEDNGGTLSTYIAGKGYLHFDTLGKTLDAATGFWVRKP